MANYLKATDFAAKDALLSGDPNKIVKGTEINDEFDSIQTAINSKANSDSPTFTGTPAAPTAVAGTQTTQIATTEFVTTAVAAISLGSVYPVGSIYINAGVTTNPATLLGFGTWVEFGAGKVLVGLDASDTSFDTLEETGGSKDAVVVSHTHTASTNTTGAHSHTFTKGDTPYSSPQSFTGQAANASTSQSTSTAGGHNHTVTVDSTGSSGTNANLQPYVVVKMWKRTA